MILVTGGTGLLGSHLLMELLVRGKKVRALYRENSDRGRLERTFGYYHPGPEALPGELEWFEADLLDIVSLEEAFRDVTQVYHCAATVSFDARNAGEMLSVNPESTAHVVNLSLEQKIDKLIYVSSVAALGRKTEGDFITEDTEWSHSRNNSIYSRSKYRAELEVWRGIQEGLNAAIVNPSVILGPGSWDTGSGALFGKVARGFKYYTMGTNAYVDVRDVVEIMIRLMESPVTGERFIVAAENISYKKLFEYIAEALGVKAPYVKVEPWLSNIIWRLEVLRAAISGKEALITRETAHTAQKAYYYDNSRRKETLRYTFRPLKETIRDLSRFYEKDLAGA